MTIKSSEIKKAKQGMPQKANALAESFFVKAESVQGVIVIGRSDTKEVLPGIAYTPEDNDFCSVNGHDLQAWQIAKGLHVNASDICFIKYQGQGYAESPSAVLVNNGGGKFTLCEFVNVKSADPDSILPLPNIMSPLFHRDDTVGYYTAYEMVEGKIAHTFERLNVRVTFIHTPRIDRRGQAQDRFVRYMKKAGL